MAFVECVVGKLFNDVEELLAKDFSVSTLFTPEFEPVAFFCHEFWQFLSAGFTQVVGFGE